MFTYTKYHVQLQKKQPRKLIESIRKNCPQQGTKHIKAKPAQQVLLQLREERNKKLGRTEIFTTFQLVQKMNNSKLPQ